MEQSKSVIMSKTVWLNVVLISLAGIEKAMDLGISPEAMVWVSGILNLALRFLTNKTLTLK